MRIAVVTETWAPEINGVALTVQTYVEQLLALGHEVELTCPERASIREICAPGLAVLRVPGLPIPRYPELRFGLPCNRRLRGRWQQRRPDAVYVATEGPLGWSAVRVAKALGIRVVTGLHTRFDDFVGHYGARWLRPLAFAWLRRFHNRADVTLVPTAELQQFLHQRGFRCVQQLARGVDSERFNPQHRDLALRARWGLAADQLAVLHVGRMAAEKNLPLVASAFSRIQQSAPGARMIWVGDGPELAALRTAHPQHVFAGMQHGLALSQHYASADLFLFPSLTDTFGNVTIEAMASGLAVLAFNYAAAGEYIDDGVNGSTVPFADTERFLDAAQTLASDPARVRRLGANARATVTTGDAHAMASSLQAALLGTAMERCR